jgi:hypothetical protein
MANRVEFTKNSLTPGLEKMIPVLHSNIFQVMRYHEPQIQAQARNKAPWKDQSSNARHGLFAKASVPTKHVYQLTLYGSVSYQIWLEVRWSGKYAIIMPTVRSYAPKVISSLHKLLDRMKIGVD